MKNLLALFLLLAFTTAQSQQDSHTVYGKVSDVQGAPLPYANVLIEGMTLGVLTDDNGMFYLSNVPFGKHTILVSFIGYKSRSKSIEINDRNRNIKLDFTLSRKY